MTNTERFYKFLEDHDYTSSWDARLTFQDGEYTRYYDQGGWFKLEEDLTFSYHDDSCGEGDKIKFKTYKDFISYFKSMYCCGY